MKKIILSIAIAIILLPAAAQQKKKFSTHLEFIQQPTIADRTPMNNPWGSGLGLQAQFFPFEKFSPFIEMAGFVYFQKYKIAYLDANDNVLPSVDDMANFFAGVSYKMSKTIYFSIAGGPSIVSTQTLFGIKHALGIYFSPRQRWKAQVAYLNVFNR
jgi:hypothetical protein